MNNFAHCGFVGRPINGNRQEKYDDSDNEAAVQTLRLIAAKGEFAPVKQQNIIRVQ
jgi:hypothetical protein